MEKRELKREALELLGLRLTDEVRSELREIDERLEEYYVGLVEHSGVEMGDENDWHNLYEILGALKLLRLLGQYEVNVAKVREVIYDGEGEWKKVGRQWVHVRGGLKQPGRKEPEVYRWQPFQVFMLVAMYGPMAWIDTGNENGTRPLLETEREGKNGNIEDLRRLCTHFIAYMPRKTNKTGFSAITNCEDFMRGDADAQVFCAANAAQQSKTLFQRTADLIRQLDPQGKRIRFTATEINWKPGQFRSATLQAMSAGGKTKDGLFASRVSGDEYGSASYVNGKSDMGQLMNVLESSMGPRREPMVVITTTAGTITAGPFMELLEGTKRVLVRECESGSYAPALKGTPSILEGELREGEGGSYAPALKGTPSILEGELREGEGGSYAPALKGTPSILEGELADDSRELAGVNGSYRELTDDSNSYLRADDSDTYRGDGHSLEDDRRMCLLLEPDEWDVEDEDYLLSAKNVRKKVNPMLGLIVQHAFYDQKVSDSRSDPQTKAETISKLFNVYQTTRTTAWIKADEVRPLQRNMRIDDCTAANGWVVFCGMDFSKGDDLHAVTYLAARRAEGGGTEFFADLDSWMTEHAVQESSVRPLWESFIQSGWLHMSPGKVLQSSLPVMRIAELLQKGVQFQAWGYDSYQSLDPINTLKAYLSAEMGVEQPEKYVVPVSQTYASYNPAVLAIEGVMRSDPPLLTLSPNPLWPFEFGNCKVDEDLRMNNRKMIKANPGSDACKIDNIQCLASAFLLEMRFEGSAVGAV